MTSFTEFMRVTSKWRQSSSVNQTNRLFSISHLGRSPKFLVQEPWKHERIKSSFSCPSPGCWISSPTVQIVAISQSTSVRYSKDLIYAIRLSILRKSLSLTTSSKLDLFITIYIYMFHLSLSSPGNFCNMYHI